MASNAFRRWRDQVNLVGDISPVRLGISRRELQIALGDPDDVGGTSGRPPRPAIWRYEQVEFHFADDALRLIYAERRDGVVALAIGQGALQPG